MKAVESKGQKVDNMTRLFQDAEEVSLGEGLPVVKLRYIPMKLMPEVTRIILKGFDAIAQKGAKEEDISILEIGKFFVQEMDSCMELIQKCCDTELDELPMDCAPIIIEKFIEMNFTGEKLKNWQALRNRITGQG